MKTFNGKAIRMPKGKAAEYAKYSCNFYVGCSNECTYCYLKKGRGSKILGGNVPKLKVCFKDKNHALQVFEKELKANLPELQKHGLFFSFTTDPMFPETTMSLTIKAMDICVRYKIPIKILTKDVHFAFENYDWKKIIGGDWLKFPYFLDCEYKNLIAFGFTLTGHDELEPNASTNSDRIEAMRKLHEAGFKTWASIEPVIDFHSSLRMILQTKDFCDLYKIGLESGAKYKQSEVNEFAIDILYNFRAKKIYFKDSFLNKAGITRSQLPENYVDRDYNMFND